MVISDILHHAPTRGRIGAIAPQLQAQIYELTITQLEALGEALLDFSHATDLVAWLQRHQH